LLLSHICRTTVDMLLRLSHYCCHSAVHMLSADYGLSKAVRQP
jgi:hypothetical protein